jgi:hypothetical protein
MKFSYLFAETYLVVHVFIEDDNFVDVGVIRKTIKGTSKNSKFEACEAIKAQFT